MRTQPPVEPEETASDETWRAYARELVRYERITENIRFLPLWLLVASLVGLYAAVELTLGKLSFWENKANGTSTALGCDINPIVGCGAVINTPPASIFGDIPNPVLGIVAWSLLAMVAILLLSKVKLLPWHYVGIQLGVIFGLSVVSYLQYQSLYNLHALCPWCMVTWAVMIPTFWIVTANNLRHWFYDSRMAALVYNGYGLFIVVHFALLMAAIWIQFGSTIFS